MMLATKNKKSEGGLKRLMKDRKGLSTVEYVIILALIAVAAIGAWTEFGETLINKVEEKTDDMDAL